MRQLVFDWTVQKEGIRALLVYWHGQVSLRQSGSVLVSFHLIDDGHYHQNQVYRMGQWNNLFESVDHILGFVLSILNQIISCKKVHDPNVAN